MNRNRGLFYHTSLCNRFLSDLGGSENIATKITDPTNNLNENGILSIPINATTVNSTRDPNATRTARKKFILFLYRSGRLGQILIIQNFYDVFDFECYYISTL